jgi:predicted metal-dependent peptidase
MHLKLSAPDKLLKSKTDLLRKFPFFGMLLIKLKIISDEIITQTMATDGKAIYYNPTWVALLTLGETIGTVVHEILHCAFLHPYRRCGRDRLLWNIACDLAINPLILDWGFTLPEGVLIEDQYRGMTAETIYSKLKKEQGDGPSQLPPVQWGEVLEPSETSEEQANNEIKGGAIFKDTRSVPEQEKDWEAAVTSATESCKGRGQGTMADMFRSGLGAPLIDWKKQFHDLTGTITKTDFAWYPPDPVYIHRKLVVPTLHEPTIGHLVFAMDTSASVNQRCLKAFNTEIHDVLSNVTFLSLTVLQCDTKIHKINVYEPDDEIDLKVVGRGGTNFAPIFEWIENEFEEEPSALIYFTDMGSSDYPDTPPDYPVFWARTENYDAPFGIHIDLYLEP